jgi:hypothetical protein
MEWRSRVSTKRIIKIQKARAKWAKTHPDSIPGFVSDGFIKDEYREEIDEERADPILARLIWLDYWMSWALENCEHPAIYNH